MLDGWKWGGGGGWCGRYKRVKTILIWWSFVGAIMKCVCVLAIFLDVVVVDVVAVTPSAHFYFISLFHSSVAHWWYVAMFSCRLEIEMLNRPKHAFTLIFRPDSRRRARASSSYVFVLLSDIRRVPFCQSQTECCTINMSIHQWRKQILINVWECEWVWEHSNM